MTLILRMDRVSAKTGFHDLQYNISREYTYVPQGSGIVYITITHRMHADRLRNAPGRAADVSARPKVGSGSEAVLARTGVYRRHFVYIRRVKACTRAVSSTSGAYRRVCTGAYRRSEMPHIPR